jgi:hypothetical protein
MILTNKSLELFTMLQIYFLTSSLAEQGIKPWIFFVVFHLFSPPLPLSYSGSPQNGKESTVNRALGGSTYPG